MNKIAELVKEKRFPYVTVGLIIINVVYFLIVALGGNPGIASYMLSRGADYAPLVFEEHEYWRLVTSMFMHFSFRHLAGNMLYLGLIGWSYERITGHVRFLLLYMFSGIGSSVVSCAYHQLSGNYAVSAGASGAVYGLIGMLIYFTFIIGKRFRSPAMYRRILLMAIFLIYSNLLTGGNIDVAAHIGGLVFGILLSFLFVKAGDKNNKEKP